MYRIQWFVALLSKNMYANVRIGRTKRRRLAMAGSHRYIYFAVLGVTLLVGYHSNVNLVYLVNLYIML